MNAFTAISSLVLYCLTFLCFYLPFNNGKKKTGIVIGVILSITITLSIANRLDTLLTWLLTLAFQITYLTYWAFRDFYKRRIGRILATILTIAILWVIMLPWISDWMFNKQDVREILTFHGLRLEDDFDILENESGGFRDYYETFSIKLSDNDFNQISQSIKKSNSYKGYFTDYSKTPIANYKTFDTIDYETENHFEREYFTKKEMQNGTHHFTIQLTKETKELSYIGSDE